MKIAIVHDWLTTYAGAERVLEQLLKCFPNADLFAPVDFLKGGERAFLDGRPVHTSFAQRLPLIRRAHRLYLPAMAVAVEQFDLSGYDLVISSSHSVAKGVLTGPDQFHVSYVHSPMRYAWDLQHQYLRETGLDRGLRSLAARWMLHKMRLWDCRTANGVDLYLANSAYIARRIKKVYGRESTVVYPPVDAEFFQPREAKEDFYLTASRLVPYKKVDAVVAAFGLMPDRRLVVIGDGPERRRIRRAAPANVTFLGHGSAEVLRDHMQRARAFIFAAEEDFGIAPVEAQACGAPVIAYGKGGARETVRGPESAGPTGLFFSEQHPGAIAAAVRAFEADAGRFAPAHCRANAMRFAPDGFRETLVSTIDAAFNAWSAAHRPGAAHGESAAQPPRRRPARRAAKKPLASGKTRKPASGRTARR